MKKYIYLLFFIILSTTSAWSQNNYQLTQYFQNAPTFNPAFTGIDNFIDIKVGYKQQWTGIDNSARTLYASAYGLLVRSKYDKIKSNSLRISDPSLYEENEDNDFKKSAGIKHGIGGYLLNDRFGPFNRTYTFLSYSFHYPITRKIQLAVGLSGGINHTRIDAESVKVKNPDIDATYQSFLSGNAVSNKFDFNTGMVLYGERFYFGYALQRLLQNSILNNDEISQDRESVGQVISAGYMIPLGSDYLFLPSIVSTIQPGLPSVVDINAKVRYQKNYWLGMNYRNAQALSIMGGIFINEMYNLSYSYDFSLDGVGQYMQGSHELVLGIMLNNDRGNVPFAW